MEKKWINLEKVKTRNNWGQLEVSLSSLLEHPEVKQLFYTKMEDIIGKGEAWADFVEPYSSTKNTHDQDLLRQVKDIELTCRYKLREEQRKKLLEVLGK